MSKPPEIDYLGSKGHGKDSAKDSQIPFYFPLSSTESILAFEEALLETVEPPREEINYIIISFACAIIVASTLFNLVLLFAVVRRGFIKTSFTGQLAFSQSLVDLALSCVIMPIHLVVDLQQIDQLMALPYFCEFWTTADVFLCTLSILHQLGLCIDRYVVMRDDLKKWLPRESRRFMIYLLIYLNISAAVAIPLVFDCQMAVTTTFVIASTTVSFYVPTVVIFALVARISFKTFHAEHCRQCVGIYHGDSNDRHALFSSFLPNHYSHGDVSRSQSMPCKFEY